MIRKSYPWLLLLAGLVIGQFVSGRFVLQAQDRGRVEKPSPSRSPRAGAIDRSGDSSDPGSSEERRPAPLRPPVSSSAATVHELLLQPYRFPFSRPTGLVQVCAHLKQTLKIPVVLDLAALGRQDVKPDDPVQLELDGVRLKTGLKLLLDQVGLTFHVVPEDNLLIITDREGSEDPLDRIWAELRALHRDLHDVQDAVDGLTDLVGGEKGDGPRVRKPTIIEEMPGTDREKPEVGREKPEDSGKKPNGARSPAPATGSRSTPSRIPLGGWHRSL
jgi:hypothetical protein